MHDFSTEFPASKMPESAKTTRLCGDRAASSPCSCHRVMNAVRRSLRAASLVRHCSANANKGVSVNSNNKPITGAIGSRGAKGSGKSLIGSAARGVGGSDKLEAIKSGKYGLGQSGEFGLGQSSPEEGTDTQLEGADVLMEVLLARWRVTLTLT